MTSALKSAVSAQKEFTGMQDPKYAFTPFTLGPFDPKENIPKKFLKKNDEVGSARVIFKAKKMPNFSAIHEKLPSKINHLSRPSSSLSSSGISRVGPSNLVSSKCVSFRK